MADNLMTTSSQVDPAVGLFYERTLLQPPQPDYIYTKYAERKSIGLKQGDTIKFRRYGRLSAATTPLVEGITPSGDRLSKVDLTAKLSQYGSYITITDVVDLTVEDPVITIAVDRQNDQMMNTMDQLARDYMCASASSVDCTNGDDTATLLNATDIAGAVQTLRSNDAKYLFRRINAGQGIGTSPVRSAYGGLAHTDLENDLRNIDGFLDVVQYSQASGIEEAEFGCTGNVRWLTSTNGYSATHTFASGSATGYFSPIIGRDPTSLPFAMVDLSGGNAQPIVKGFGSGGTNDPLDQRTTVGWKAWQAFRILQDLYILVVISTNA